jgi:hypothetical protein
VNKLLPLAVIAGAATIGRTGRRASVDDFDFFGDFPAPGAPTPSAKTPKESALAQARRWASKNLASNAPAEPSIVALQGILKPEGLQKAQDAGNTSTFVWQPQFGWYLWSDAASRKAAERWGRGIKRQMISKRALHYSVPQLHDKPLILGYRGANAAGADIVII